MRFNFKIKAVEISLYTKFNYKLLLILEDLQKNSFLSRKESDLNYLSFLKIPKEDFLPFFLKIQLDKAYKLHMAEA